MQETQGGAGGPQSSKNSGVGSAQQLRASRVRQKVRTCGVLSRTVASGVFEGVLKGQAEVFKQASRSAAGKACLTRWDIQGEDVIEQRENLLRSAGLYQDMDWPSTSDDEVDF